MIVLSIVSRTIATYYISDSAMVAPLVGSRLLMPMYSDFDCHIKGFIDFSKRGKIYCQLWCNPTKSQNGSL